MKDIFRQLEKVIDTRATVCIEGETGTGKEVIASAIHYQGKRRDKLFVAQNCAALPETLLESELFGHKKGSFTGADHDKKGLFEIADGGTLFLDEIGEMTLNLQAKLLRVLPGGRDPPRRWHRQQGHRRPHHLRHQSLARERGREGSVPPGPVLPAARVPHPAAALARAARGRAAPRRPLPAQVHRRDEQARRRRDAGGARQLSAYSWPGNIRELENEVQRFVIQCDPEGFITPDLLAPRCARSRGCSAGWRPRRARSRT